MKIVNLTQYDSQQLRAIAQRVAENELDPDQRRGVRIHFVIAKTRSVEAREARSRSYYRRAVGQLPPGLKFNQAIINIGRNAFSMPPRTMVRMIALRLAHEFAEMRGLTHVQMRTPRYFFKDGWSELYAWADAFLLQPKVKLTITPVDKANLLLKRAYARRKTAATRFKRATTLLKKWDRKVKYYEKRARAPP